VAINSLKNNKTPGIDQISGDLLKVDAHTSAVILLPLFIRILTSRGIPKTLEDRSNNNQRTKEKRLEDM
jgi:hypothetical protein